MQRQIRLIATQIYIHRVKERSREKSFGTLEKRLLKNPSQSNEVFWEKKSGIFYKYAKGHTPIVKEEQIDKIEEFPGAKSILSHPLWVILENRSYDLETIHDLMRSLDPEIQAHLFKKNIKTNFYERKVYPYGNAFCYIDMHNNLDALACFLMLIREMEISERWFGFTEAKWFALGIFLRLSFFTPVSKVADHLYKVIHEQFIDRNNSLASGCTIRFTRKTYSPPSFLSNSNRQSINKKLSNILSNAEDHGFDVPDKQSQLRFLSWVFIFGLEKTQEAFKAEHPDTENQKLINKLLSIYRSTNLRRDIPRYHVHEIFNPISEH